MNNNYYEPVETEIDLLELCKKLLIQWKAVLITCLIFALIVPSLVYLKDSRAYSAQLKAEEEALSSIGSADEQIAEIYEALTDADRAIVEQALWQDEMIADMDEYTKSSPLMRMDPNSVRTLCLGYRITGINNKRQMAAIYAGYYSAFDSNRSLKALRDSIGGDFESQYVDELVQLYDKESNQSVVSGTEESESVGVLQVYVMLPEDADEDAVTSAVDDIMAARCKDLSKDITEHRTTRYFKEVQNSFSLDITNKMRDASTRLIDMQSRQKTFVSGLTEEQKAAYEGIRTIMDNEKLAETSAKDGNPADNAAAAAEQPSFSVKFALVGFLLGGFLYAGIYVVILVLGRRVGSAGTAQSLMGARLIGEYYGHEKKGGLRALLASEPVIRLFYGNKMDADRQADSVARSLQAICADAEIERLSFVCTRDGKAADEMAEKVMAACISAGIEAEMIDAAADINEMELVDVTDAVYLIDGKTGTGRMSNVWRLLSEYKIQPHGLIYTEEL